MQKVRLWRNPLLWGTSTLVVLTVSALVAAFLYISPPGQRSVVFYTDDSVSVHANDTVRISGIIVGKVKDVALESSRVRVRLTVDRDAYVGDRSQIQVRMLTVVGGYFVNLISLGNRPLGDAPIPIERVKMPYSLSRALAEATKITDGVDAQPVSQSLDQTQQGLQGTNLETLSALIDAGNKLTVTIERQRGQLTKVFNLSEEYISAIANQEEMLRSLVRSAALLEQTLTIYSEEYARAWQLVGHALMRVDPVARFYTAHRDKFVGKLETWLVRFRTWADKSGAMVQWLRGQRAWMERILDSQNARPELIATDLCMPVGGGGC